MRNIIFLKFLKFLAFMISIKILLKGFFKQYTPKNQYEEIMWRTKDAIIDRRLRQFISLIVGMLLFCWSFSAIVGIIKEIGSQ
ncbi:hypothetical protein HS141_15950 [Cetobacterium somerae]|nr:hypothetical protein [Cetobacterium somerae]